MMAAIRRVWEKWRIHRERRNRLNASRNANPDFRWHGNDGAG
jgi:hypothetical protein